MKNIEQVGTIGLVHGMFRNQMHMKVSYPPQLILSFVGASCEKGCTKSESFGINQIDSHPQAESVTDVEFVAL